jgi:hypothetical protein
MRDYSLGLPIRLTHFRMFSAIIGLIFFLSQATAQQSPPQPKAAIQFSGIVITEENGEMVPVPYVNIYIPKRHIGTTTALNGFFSIVAEKGEKVVFSAVGFGKGYFVIPDTLKDDHYSIVQTVYRDTFTLPTAFIFPWPSREHFKTEFLAMNIHDELQKRAAENLSAENLAKERERLPHDGVETGNIYLRQQAKATYYYGQAPPMNIFNPIAWGKFFSAWKKGDFKKKKPVNSVDDDKESD